MTESELLDIACRAARAAGAELLSRWQGPLEVSTKSTPTDPVSEADIAAEAAIREILGRERPSDSILGEEGGQTHGDGSDAGGLRWVIDPLDGTVNYLYGIPAFAVSIAVEDHDGGLAGVIHDPVSDQSYAATRSGPALRICSDEPTVELHGSDCARLDRALVATGFAYDTRVRAGQGRVVGELLPQVRDIRRVGSAALDLALLAAGRVDAYYERGIKSWDIAAGKLVCERAGLVVRELPELIDSDPSITVPSGILVAPTGFVDELYELVGGAHPAG